VRARLLRRRGHGPGGARHIGKVKKES
jgi:hypothetical protein